MHVTDEIGAAIRAAAERVSAPADLRMRVDAAQAAPAPRVRRRRFALAGMAGATVGAAALAVVLALPGGSPGGPSVADAALIALRPAAAPAPAIDAARPYLLRRSVDGIPFPRWHEHFAWRATGQRMDRLDGHAVTTVFYARGPVRIGYAILDLPALSMPKGASSVVRGATRFSVLRSHGATVVTWRRAGHTCVLAGRGADARSLLALASWDDAGALPGYG